MASNLDELIDPSALIIWERVACRVPPLVPPGPFYSSCLLHMSVEITIPKYPQWVWCYV